MDRIDSMRMFVRTAQRASFSAAARELRVSAATVTKCISALERQLGVRLFERTTRRVQLTEAGRVYLDRCGETLQSFDDAEAALSALTQAPAGVLRLTAPLELARELASVITIFQRNFPAVIVDLRLSEQNVDLIEQGYDLGIGLPNPSHDSYVARRLCTSQVLAVAAPAYLRAHGEPRKPSDLGRHRHLIFVEPRPRTDWTIRKGKRTTKVALSAACFSNSGTALLALASEGAGIAFAPSFLVCDALASGRLVRLFSEYEIGKFGLFVRYPSRRFLPAKVRCFLEALRMHFGDDPEADLWLRTTLPT